MAVNVYPRDDTPFYTPFKVFAIQPYDCIISIKDRYGSTIYVHTHKAGLLLLKEQIDSVLNSLNKPKTTEKE